jgi:hypothetical protein
MHTYRAIGDDSDGLDMDGALFTAAQSTGPVARGADPGHQTYRSTRQNTWKVGSGLYTATMVVGSVRKVVAVAAEAPVLSTHTRIN